MICLRDLERNMRSVVGSCGVRSLCIMVRVLRDEVLARGLPGWGSLDSALETLERFSVLCPPRRPARPIHSEDCSTRPK